MKERWQYIHRDGLDLDEMNELGFEGWELVGFGIGLTSRQMIFKRKLEPSAEDHLDEMDKQFEMMLGDDDLDE